MSTENTAPLKPLLFTAPFCLSLCALSCLLYYPPCSVPLFSSSYFISPPVRPLHKSLLFYIISPPQFLLLVFPLSPHCNQPFYSTQCPSWNADSSVYVTVFCLTFEDRTDRLTRNVGKKLPFFSWQLSNFTHKFFSMYLFICSSLHVSSMSCSTSGETNCINTASGDCHSVNK